VGLIHGGVVIWNLEEVRARLAEFGIEVPSTVVNRAAISPPPPAPDSVFQEMLRGAGKAARDVAELDKLPRESSTRPPPGDARNTLAWLLATWPEERLRNPSRAVKLAEEAVALSPEVGSFWNTLGVAQYRAGNLAAAREALEKSLSLSQGNEAFDWFFLAMIDWRSGREAEAREVYRKAVEWADRNAPGNAELARFRAEANDVMRLRP
jgi:tetratricopeptide (TPR) repeat protein